MKIHTKDNDSSITLSLMVISIRHDHIPVTSLVSVIFYQKVLRYLVTTVSKPVN